MLGKQMIHRIMAQTDDGAVGSGLRCGDPGHSIEEGRLAEDAAGAVGGEQPFFSLVGGDERPDSAGAETVEVRGFLTL